GVGGGDGGGAAAFGGRGVLGDGAPGDGDLPAVQQSAAEQFGEDGGQAARVAEVLHEVGAAGHQVDQGGHRADQVVEVLQGQFDADASGEGRQMDEGVGGAADGRVDPDRVLERLPGQDPDRKSTRLNSSHVKISYAVFCLKKKNTSL